MLYCAGLYDPMTVQDWEPEAAEEICEVNFMGVMRVLGRVAPRMAQRGRGRHTRVCHESHEARGAGYM